MKIITGFLVNKKFLAIIPARGGSKRLPNKNILEIASKPLITHTIEAALNSKYISSVVVTSDSDEILNITSSLGANIIKRDENLSSDTSSSVDVVLDVISKCDEFEYIILLQPTSPLRTSFHIDEAIKILKEKNADALVSVCEMEHSPLWSNSLPDDDCMENFLDKSLDGKRSQELKKYYRLNGAIYIVKTKRFLEEKSFFLSKNIFAYKMDRKSSIDIDEKIDFDFAKMIMESNSDK